MAIREAALPPDHPDLATSLNNLANVIRELGEEERASELLERALAIYEKKLGAEHSDVAMVLYNLGDAMKSAGN